MIDHAIFVVNNLCYGIKWSPNPFFVALVHNALTQPTQNTIAWQYADVDYFGFPVF